MRLSACKCDVDESAASCGPTYRGQISTAGRGHFLPASIPARRANGAAGQRAVRASRAAGGVGSSGSTTRKHWVGVLAHGALCRRMVGSTTIPPPNRTQERRGRTPFETPYKPVSKLCSKHMGETLILKHVLRRAQPSKIGSCSAWYCLFAETVQHVEKVLARLMSERLLSRPPQHGAVVVARGNARSSNLLEKPQSSRGRHRATVTR